MTYEKPYILFLGDSSRTIQGSDVSTKFANLIEGAPGHQGELTQAISNAYDADE
jgi:hypothetical protein